LNGEYFTIRGETTGAFRRLAHFPRSPLWSGSKPPKPHGAFFEIEDARLLAMDESRDEFVQIAAPAHEATIAQARF